MFCRVDSRFCTTFDQGKSVHNEDDQGNLCCFLCCAMPPVALLFSGLQREGRWGGPWTEEGSVTLPCLCVTTLSDTHPHNYPSNHTE